MSDTKSFPLVNVNIHSARGKDVIQVQVPEHEIAVLQVIHGANVIVGDPHEDDIELQASASAELGRLQRKYRQPGQADPVRHALPNGVIDLARAGFDAHGESHAAPQSSIRKHPKPKAVEKKAGK